MRMFLTFLLMSVASLSLGGEKPVMPTSVSSHKVMSEDSLQWKRDPFAGNAHKNKLATNSNAAKKSVPTALSEDINLQGIMSVDNRYHALINGLVYKVGDSFGGWTILEISRYHVVVRKNKEKYIFDIHKGKIPRGEK